ncbi:uncharacterized protein FOMMEDRAFT_164682 [Fomitiporia mediterranea MF3/22]|uniref:uncharacterized protein n=1 Tax=Fomitiporia mediterranea (strain MF3/22) TaxID=694068 RepID=UPI0004407648|nr:uncharacterized protein FOMMEDRAFT_164682 [Fomitiporia mediterranea MF3/22]EJD07819.1 hypothetical protein FOMMEDRAFT_164682 [Fomitiporia mediterranea MF3/22]
MATLDPSDIASLPLNAYIARATIVVTITALTYDYLLTIGREKELIWPSRISVVKILFLLNRYVPFVGISGATYVLISLDTSAHSQKCVPAFWVFGGTPGSPRILPTNDLLNYAGMVIAEYVFAELILYTRAYAVWGCTRPALVMTIGTILAVFTPGLYLASSFLKSAKVVNPPIFPTGCLIYLDGHIDMLAMIAVVVSEAACLLAVLVKATRMPRSMTMQQIVADGILFFVVIICVTTANLVVLNVASPEVCNLLLAPQAALHSICCNRLILQIKAASTQTQCSRASVSLPPMSSLQSYETQRSELEMQPLQ